MEFYEGCLSVEGYQAIVPRARSVRVHALNHKAEPIVIDASGWYARILQHEIDHLGGTLYIDRMRSRTLATARNFSRYWAGVPIEEVLATLETARRATALMSAWALFWLLAQAEAAPPPPHRHRPLPTACSPPRWCRCRRSCRRSGCR